MTPTGCRWSRTGMLTGNFLHPLLAEAFKKFPSDDWVEAGEAAGMGVATGADPGRGAG